MKRLLTLGTMILCSMLSALAQFSGSGSGTEESPYLIFNVTQLSQLSNFGGQEGVVFRLMKDIDVSEWISDNNPRQGWTPVGVQATPFQGKLLGENHKITGLSITRASESYVGFFGYLSGATITDLTIEGSDVTGGSNVGTFVGYATNSTLTNCHAKLSGKVSSSSGNYVGGFAGTISSCTINNFSVEATVSSTGASYVGGFAGSVSGELSNGTVTGNVTNNKPYTGGFAGTGTPTVSDILVTGNVTGTTYVGGFLGDGGGSLTNCSVSGNVTGQDYLGGFIGQASSTSFNTCNYVGDMSGNGYIGGVAGNLVAGSSSTFTSCFSKGKITATSDYVGGIVGASQGGCVAGMESCSHFGDIVAKSYVGGLIGSIHDNSSTPELHTYHTYVSKGIYSWSDTYKDEIIEGTIQNLNINNSISIANITGNSEIGGLIGHDEASVGYTSEGTTETFTTSSGERWATFSKDGVGQSGTITYTVYKYYHNTICYQITNCYYSGDLLGKSAIGGLVGLKNGGIISSCYSLASLDGEFNIGGIVGQISGTTNLSQFTNSTKVLSNVSNNSFISASIGNVGRIYGSAESEYAFIGALGSTQGNRALVTTKVVKSGILQEVNDDLQNGTSIGANALKLKATYGALGWNFDTDWNQLETESYPYKKYQAAPPTITSTLESQATTISGKSTDGGTVYLYYKDKEPVSTVCNGNDWSFTTEPLQSGAQVQVYADAEGLTPSYFATTNVAYPGLGTEVAPYLIYTAEDLQGVNKSGYYKVMNDIDLTSWINENSPTEGWPAIGLNGSEAVYIDGDYHKIKGLWTNTTKDFNGLFSSFLVGQIKNLTVEVATGKKVKGGDYTGILIGRMANAKIVNCTLKGDVEGTLHVGGIAGSLENSDISTLVYSGNVATTTTDAYAGGITGMANGGSMKSCQAEGTVSGTLYVGGIAGFVSQAELQELTFSGSLASNTDEASVGGLIGKTETCMLTGGNAMSTITTSGNTAYVGGAIGYADGGEITKSVANDNITVSGSENYVGGLVGYSDAVITLSNANGSVTATGENSYTGGLVGYAKGNIANCYSTANVKGTQYTAGLVGYTFAAIDKCYAKGNVTGQFYGAGVVANMDGAEASTTNCAAMNNTLSLTAQTAWASRVIGGYGNGCADPDESNFALNTMQVSLNGIPTKKYDDIMEGTSKTQAELMQSSTYLAMGWDLTKDWFLNENETYPLLLWEIDANPVSEIILDNTSLLLAVDKTATIGATILPLSASNKRLTWTSSNTAVATVEDGVVTAISEGCATITATSTDGSNVKATCQVTVTANKDAAIASLQEDLAHAQTLYDNSTEGEEIGQYAVGARAELLDVINRVNASISDTMDDELLAQCIADIQAAIALFESKKISGGDDTDITQLSNAIFIAPLEALTGSELVATVELKNAIEVGGYSFDFVLPEGVSVAKNAKGKFTATLIDDRHDEHSISVNYADGYYSVAVLSLGGGELSGNDGGIISLPLVVSSDIPEGTYPIEIRNVKFSTPAAVSVAVPNVTTSITVSDVQLGDVNQDGQIDIADAIGIVNRVVRKDSATFIEKAADVNGDGQVDIADAIAVVNIVVRKSSGARQRKAHTDNLDPQ